jgi:hypothetical protein
VRACVFVNLCERASVYACVSVGERVWSCPCLRSRVCAHSFVRVRASACVWARVCARAFGSACVGGVVRL